MLQLEVEVTVTASKGAGPTGPVPLHALPCYSCKYWTMTTTVALRSLNLVRNTSQTLDLHHRR